MKPLVLAAALLAAVSAFAQESAQSPAAHYFANLPLIDQNGHRVDLYNDLMKGKTVVINTFFATCQGSCPVMAKTFQQIQDRIGDRLGRDVVLISITVDPKTDTPAALKSYAEKMQAKPGWSFLTGTPEQIDAALRKLGQAVDTRESHMNIIIVGNDRTGLWKKVFGLAKPGDVYDVVATVMNDRGPS